VFVVCCVGSSLCGRLITGLEESYCVYVLVVCDPSAAKRGGLGPIWAVAPQKRNPQVEHPLPEMLGTGNAPDFGFFSDCGIPAYYNEIAWGWEPNLNAKSVYVSYTAYVYIGFI
jgi:hypothetical protein